MRRAVNPAGATPPQFYSHAVEVSAPQRFLFVSGQVGVRADGSLAEGMAEQAAVAVQNLRAVLAEAGMGVADVVKYTIYLTDEAQTGAFMQAAAGLVTDPPAATTLLYVKALADPAMLVEIEAVAAA